ncbi:hypothetical protein [Verrucomicrobium sp. BvORR106]|uniref:hypothetical protein n=1 Tax=Verrucomicrobium sp. BvORR106 TaxID=1403819 RepID=UPI002240FBA9|nr:hypothetical protein [Verrucomicrobium sp. BvORR106]
MKRTFDLVAMRTLMLLVLACSLTTRGLLAQSPSESAPPPPSAYVNVVNVTGLEGEVTVLTNNKQDESRALSKGGETGECAVTPGSVTVKVSHPTCPADVEQKFVLKVNERLNLLVHALVVKGENGSAPITKLVLLPLQHLPSPGKTTLTLLNCDAQSRAQSLALNGAELTLEPLQPMHLTELAAAGRFTLTFKGSEIMAPYEPLTEDHVYLVVYVDLENPRLNGVVITDRKRGTVDEELDLKKKEVAQRIARERKAAEWVLKELERKTQERAEARAQRQKQRAPEIKR